MGDKERVDLMDAEAGTYVLRVLSFASTTPTYTLTEELFESVTTTTAGQRESYTLTSEKRGKVVQETQLFIDPGTSQPRQARSPDRSA